MSFKVRVLSMMGGALLVAFVALAYSLSALYDTRDRFTGFVDRDLAELQSLEDMYAQGLQSGQALRNVVLDYSNKQGHKNLAKALEDFSAAARRAEQLAGTVPEKLSLIRQLGELQQKRKQAMDKVLLAAAEDRGQAVTLLNREETPVWREIRKLLLETLEAKKQLAGEARDGTIRQVERAVMVAALLGLVSIVLAFVLMGRLASGLQRTLGGEPAEAGRVMQQVAAGDLTVSLCRAPKGSLLANLDDMVRSLRGVLGEIERQTAALASGAREISRDSAGVSESARQESESVSSMAATIEQFSVSAAHISDGAGATRSDSESAVELSRDGEEKVRLAAEKIGQIALTVTTTSEKIRSLDQRADQISAMAGAIKDIAGQTNLLALNAAIEAARAGEQGRGFAVVADEVRKLAERTSLATVEIEGMISGIQHDTEGAVQAMNSTLPQVDEGGRLAREASVALCHIREGAARTLERIKDVADATQEQSTASAVVADQVENVARMVEETSAMVLRTAQTAGTLENVAAVLQTEVARFRI